MSDDVSTREKDSSAFLVGDYFEIKKDSINLLSIIKLYKNKNIVISLNSPWGNGKTWFIDKCIIDWNRKGIKTILYDAWKDETQDDPFISFSSAIFSYLYNESDKFKAESNSMAFKNTVGKMAKYLIPIATRFLIGKAIDIDSAGATIQAAINGTDGILEELTRGHKEKTDAENEFRVMLSTYASDISKTDYPLIIIIDELDRCSPSYMIHFLEILKHYFEINNIVFVIAIDKEQICTSIKHHYGAEISPNDYLRKIISIQYRLDIRNSGWGNYILNLVNENSIEAKPD